MLTHCRAHCESAAHHAYDCSRKACWQQIPQMHDMVVQEGIPLSTADLLQHMLVLKGYSMLQKQACKEDVQHASRSCCLPASV